MVNFFNSYYFCLFFCFLAQIFSFNPGIEARNHSPSNFEFNVDVNAIMNCNNLNDQIDNFINIGIQYQQASSKKFKYKKFLKKAYKYLEEQNVKVDKKLKKDMKRRVQKRITERFFGHSKKIPSQGQKIAYSDVKMVSSKNPKVEYSNGFREGIMEIAIGGICVAYGGVTTKGVGIGLIVDGGGKFIKATSEYIWPERNDRDRFRDHEKDRDGQRPSMADRGRDADRDRNRSR